MTVQEATRTDVQDRLARTLAGMGDTPEAVAETIRAAGVTGTCAEPDVCAVANYLAYLGFSEPSIIKSSGSTAYLATVSAGDKIDVEQILSENSPIARFIDAFDRRDFPDLITSYGLSVEG